MAGIFYFWVSCNSSTGKIRVSEIDTGTLVEVIDTMMSDSTMYFGVDSIEVDTVEYSDYSEAAPKVGNNKTKPTARTESRTYSSSDDSYTYDDDDKTDTRTYSSSE